MGTQRFKRMYAQEWMNKENSNLVAVKAYPWVDRVLIIDEAEGRKVLESITFTEFSKKLNDWIEINEYKTN